MRTTPIEFQPFKYGFRWNGTDPHASYLMWWVGETWGDMVLETHTLQEDEIQTMWQNDIGAVMVTTYFDDVKLHPRGIPVKIAVKTTITFAGELVFMKDACKTFLLNFSGYGPPPTLPK